jgi:predicted nucleic acid-binding protein
MRVFLDTNIIIDVLTGRDGFEDSKRLLELCEAKVHIGYLTTNAVTDIDYILSKALSRQERVAKLQSIFQIVDVAVIEKSDLVGALNHEMSDYEDAVLTLCAKRYKADFIATKNIKDFEKAEVPAILPGEINF